MKNIIAIRLTKLFFSLLMMGIALGLFACAGSSEQTPTPPPVATQIVTRIVERIIERTVVVDPLGTPISIVTPTPEFALPTKPAAEPTPFEIGKKGDFTKEDLNKLFEVWELVESEFYGDLPTDSNLTDAVIAAAKT